MHININAFTQLQHNENHIHIAFSSPQRVISSAILNGGLMKADHIVNWKVPKHASACEAPEKSLSNYAKVQGWQGHVVGMMTAASMDSLRIEQACVEDVDITVLVTTGLSNARRAGDKADIQKLLATTDEIGTINLVLIFSAQLTDAAMVEAMMIATEAKAAALQHAKVLSPISGLIATGTGTDAIAVASGYASPAIKFCGKHVLLGEWIGRLVIAAVTRSLTFKSAHDKSGVRLRSF
ncbi:MAG: adenosylcobinamide amidohydrolase [Ghiorsea sp.]|nr:adenosylcobinamide amidohydrolase [Ghiorsea sp.]